MKTITMIATTVIVVLNDEAHHCYRRKPDDEDEVLIGAEDRAEAKQRDEEARVWLSGLEAIANKIGIRMVYDLSATPFFLKGSGYSEGTLFPWVVSDFGLVDAIEAGLVKIPRVPVEDDTLQEGGAPTYRNLWGRIRDDLPKKGRKTDAIAGPPQLPAPLQGALHSLYTNYQKAFDRWDTANADGSTPPSSSWCATTPTSQSSSTTTSRGTRRRIRMDQQRSSLALSASSRTNTLEGGHIDQ